MMAARFRSITWVTVALVPALACYLVTQHVAAERAELAKVDRRIGETRRAIRDLETELGTRGNLAQIERWNGETFALAAPSAEQFVTDGVQLASLTALPPVARAATPGTVATPPAPAPSTAATAPAETRAAALPAASAGVRQAALKPVERAPRTEVRQASFKPVEHASRAEVRQASFKPARRTDPVAEPEPQPLLRAATFVKPSRERVAPTRVAMLAENGPLGAGTLADIGRIAKAERGSRRR